MLAMTLCKISSGPTNSRMPFCRQDGAWLRGMASDPQLFLRKQVMPTSAAELAGYSRTPPKWKVAEQLWF
jgi:hypothetical protein